MNILIALASLVLLYAVIYGIVLVWDRGFAAADAKKTLEDARSPEGAFRFFFHVLWVLLFLALAVFLFPLLVSYKDALSQQHGSDRLETMGKMVFLPGAMLLLLAYGRRRGYMRWLEDLRWPRRDQ